MSNLKILRLILCITTGGLEGGKIINFVEKLKRSAANYFNTQQGLCRSKIGLFVTFIVLLLQIYPLLNVWS